MSHVVIAADRRTELEKEEIKRPHLTMVIIGVGAIGSMLAETFLEQGLVVAKELRLCHHHPDRLADLCSAWPGVELVSEAATAVAGADIVIVAVQPAKIPGVLQEISPTMSKTARLWLTTSHLPDALLRHFWQGAAVTCLPTVAGRYGRGTVLAHAAYGTASPDRVVEGEDPAGSGQFVEADSFAPVPSTEADLVVHPVVKEEFTYYFSFLCRRLMWVEDSGFAVLNNITGCAPAFVCSLMESAARAVAAVEPDYDRADLLAVAAEAFSSTCLLLENEDLSPADLVTRVGAPGGITHTAMAALEEAMPAVWQDLIRRSTDRHAQTDREIAAAAAEILDKKT